MNPKTQTADTASKISKKPAPQAPAFDTLKAARNLKNAEFGDKQAVTLVETIQDAQNELATKADLANTELALRTDMEKMEAGIRTDMEKMEAGIRTDMEKMEAGIRTDMEKMEAGIRTDMEKMGASLLGEIQKLRGEMEARFNKLSWQVLTTTGGTVVASTSILGLMILFK